MSFWTVFWLNVLWFVGGYIASAFTWDRFHTFLVGAEQKVLDLRDQARALEAKLRGK